MNTINILEIIFTYALYILTCSFQTVSAVLPENTILQRIINTLEVNCINFVLNIPLLSGYSHIIKLIVI